MSEYTYIALSTLNDFIFCPYSIYLHSVYMETDEDLYKASPQTRGTLAHEGVDKKSGSTRAADIFALPVFSAELGVCGKIDVYKQTQQWLIERKQNLKTIFRGQIYQLWAQYFCLLEMGYEVRRLSFYEIATNKMTDIPLPSPEDKQELVDFIARFRAYRPQEDAIEINTNKCAHCIYCNLCDKTDADHVYA